MAKAESLARSFYDWLARTTKRLRDARSASGRTAYAKLPKNYPTTLLGLRDASACACDALEATSFAPRAAYWRDLFASIVENGWQGAEVAQ